MFEVHKRGRAMIFSWLELGLGKILVDKQPNPSVGALFFPPLCFIAGDSDSECAIDLIWEIPPQNIMIPPDDAWAFLIQKEWGDQTHIQHRTRMSPKLLSIEHIRRLRHALPSGFGLYEIKLQTMLDSDSFFWEGMLPFFGSFENFIQNGFGYCIKSERKVVSVAYTAFPYTHDFEVQVTTLNSPKYRRKGLATIVSSALIEDGLSKGVTPQWDAANSASVQLALKLGYSDPDPYDVYYRLE